MSLRIAAALALLPFVVPPTAVAAQDSTACSCRVPRPPVHSAFARRSAGDFSAIQTRPLGDMARNIGFGYGVDGAYLFRVDRAGYLSLRGDLGFGQYGDASKRVALSPTIGDRIQVRVVTENDVAIASVGPQLERPTGLVRPYVNAGVGAQFFFTDSHLDDVDGASDLATTTNQHDWTPVWVAGGGVTVPLVARDVKVLLDAGVQFLNGGHARYLRPDSIQDLPDGSIAITPFDSETHMAVVHLGVRIGL